MNLQIALHERSQVGEARREAVRLAQALALDAPTIDRLALVVTEAATNLVKHARAGAMLLRALGTAQAPGVEVIALDRGPGMTNVAACMRDGHSTAGSPGLGLGSISRLARGLDVYSQPGAGTVLRFELWKQGREPASSAIAVGAVCVAKAGEQVSGDAWTEGHRDEMHRLLVVDGLGHGPDAAAAAGAALRAADKQPELSPDALLAVLHAALRSTRGAAAAAASVSTQTRRGIYAGIGNIRGLVRDGEATRHLVSHNGTLGHQVRKIQPFEFAFPDDALLVMHSDGIASHWSFDAYPGLARRHPAVIAAVLYRDHARERDDATVAVLGHSSR